MSTLKHSKVQLLGVWHSIWCWNKHLEAGTSAKLCFGDSTMTSTSTDHVLFTHLPCTEHTTAGETGEYAWRAFSRQPSRGALCSCVDACGWHQQSVKRQGLPRALVPWPYHCFTTVCPSIRGPLLHWAFHRASSLASANLLCSPVNQDIATALNAAAVICGHLLPSMRAFISTETLKILTRGEFRESYLASRCILAHQDSQTAKPARMSLPVFKK